MSHVYAASYGPDWLSQIVSGDKLSAWTDRAAEEAKSRGRRGALGMANAGLSYANFYDLISIADQRWAPLAPALGEKKEAMVLLRRLERLRNAVAHSRPLVPFEESLIAGIAGQVRNQVTIYMSAQDPAGEIYPRIESITDSFGRRIESSTVEGEIAGSIVGHSIVLHPGDSVSFTCVGFDPQNRDLHWRLGSLPVNAGIRSRSGEEVSLVWEVTEADVKETVSVEIYMQGYEAKYRRFGWFDHRAYFTYKVRPPGL